MDFRYQSTDDSHKFFLETSNSVRIFFEIKKDKETVYDRQTPDTYQTIEKAVIKKNYKTKSKPKSQIDLRKQKQQKTEEDRISLESLML